MILETALAYLHLAGVLSWVVFISSTAALARTEWLNAAAVHRLVVLDRIAIAALLLILLTGSARMGLGVKGAAWYGAQPLLWAKAALLAAMAAAAWRTHHQLRAWQQRLQLTGELPPADDVATLRRRVMRAAHLMLVLPLLAVMLARGVGTV